MELSHANVLEPRLLHHMLKWIESVPRENPHFTYYKLARYTLDAVLTHRVAADGNEKGNPQNVEAGGTKREPLSRTRSLGIPNTVLYYP